MSRTRKISAERYNEAMSKAYLVYSKNDKVVDELCMKGTNTDYFIKTKDGNKIKVTNIQSDLRNDLVKRGIVDLDDNRYRNFWSGKNRIDDIPVEITIYSDRIHIRITEHIIEKEKIYQITEKLERIRQYLLEKGLPDATNSCVRYPQAIKIDENL